MKAWKELVQTRTRRVAVMVITLILLFIVAGLFLPTHWRVAREVIIAAPPAKIFPYINDLKKWREWTVWYESNPNMSTEYSARTEGVGATSRWVDGDGRGALKIMSSNPNSRVDYTVIFDGGAWVLHGSLRVISLDHERSRVLWHVGGEAGANPAQRYFAVLVRWWVGSDVERSLEKLRSVIEGAQSPLPSK